MEVQSKAILYYIIFLFPTIRSHFSEYQQQFPLSNFTPNFIIIFFIRHSHHFEAISPAVNSIHSFIFFLIISKYLPPESILSRIFKTPIESPRILFIHLSEENITLEYFPNLNSFHKMCPTAGEGEQKEWDSLDERLELLVDKLPSECNANPSKNPMEKPRFVHAILVVPTAEENGEIQKASLKRQLDAESVSMDPNDVKMDSLVGKGRIQEKIEFYEKAESQKREKQQKMREKMNGNGNNGQQKALANGNIGINLEEELLELGKCSPFPAAEIDAIAEAVRILREAREMLDEKLRKIGGKEEWHFAPKAKEIKTGIFNPPPPLTSPKQQKTIPVEPISEQQRQRPQRLLSSGFSFPSESRKYRSTAIVES